MTHATAPIPGRDATVTLREITRATVYDILELEVAESQRNFVATNAKSLAEAYFYRAEAWFRAIYADETPVGFLMLCDDPAKSFYYLWRFMIDARYQGLGFGKRALQLVIDHVRTRPNAAALSLSCVPASNGAGPFYEKMGFVYTGEEDDGELVMRLTW